MDQDYRLSETVRFPTRDELLAARRQEETGFLLELTRPKGYQAHVRRLSLAELGAHLDPYPEMQATVLRAYEEAQDRGGDAPGGLTWEKLKDNLRDNLALADAFCVGGFVRPKVVATEAELAGDPGAVLVTDLARDDRLAYLNACIGRGKEAADRLLPFPAPGVAGLAAVPAGPADGAAAERPAGASAA